MRQTKRRIEPFSFFNQTGICEHLEKMAGKGWMIEKFTNLGWVYQRMEPKGLKFAVSYYPKASEFDPEPTEGQKIFHEFCAHTGWELVCTSAQMQIFCNERENPIPIATEPELELEAIHASAKKSFIPYYFVLLGLSVLQGALFISNLLGDPIDLLSSPTHLFTGFCFVLLFLLCAVELVCYFRWYGKAKSVAAHGEFLKPTDTSKFQKTILIVVIACGVCFVLNLIFSGDPMRRWIMFLMCLYFPLLYRLVDGTKEFLKRKKASRGINRTATMGVSFILSVGMIGAITFATLKLSQSGFFATPGEETYEYGGMTWVIHQDELPLTIEDLTDVEYDGYIKTHRGDESILLGQLVMNQRPRFDAEDYRQVPTLKYTMTVVKLPFLYEMCKNILISEEENDYPFDRTYETQEAAPWGAKEVYRRYDPEYGFDNNYLLCYDHVLVEIRFDWEPTAEQMAIVGEKLGV